MKFAILLVLAFLWPTALINGGSTYPVITVVEFGWDVPPHFSVHDDDYVCGELYKIFHHPDVKNPMTVTCHYWPYSYIDESWMKRANARSQK